MRTTSLSITLFAVLAPLSAFGDDGVPKPTLQTFKSKPARDAVRRYLDKASSYETRLEELIDEAKSALEGDLRKAMAEAVSKGDDTEVKRISTFLTTGEAADRGGRKSVRDAFENPDKQSQKVEALSSLLPEDHAFLLFLRGKSFVIPKQGKVRSKRWSFHPDGTWWNEGRRVGRWAAIDDRLVVVSDGEYFDVVKFSLDLKKFSAAHIGTFEKSNLHYEGFLATQ